MTTCGKSCITFCHNLTQVSRFTNDTHQRSCADEKIEALNSPRAGVAGPARLETGNNPSGAAQRIYNIFWPDPVDTFTLSPDTLRLTGGIQCGVTTGGPKSAPCPGVF